MKKYINDNYEFIFARHKTNQNCFFAVYLLKYNHHSMRKPKNPYLLKWMDNAKYIAICEGDDYWTDQQKLQQQYNYMDSKSYQLIAIDKLQLNNGQLDGLAKNPRYIKDEEYDKLP